MHFRRALVWTVGVFAVLFIVATVPVLHRGLGPKLFCYTLEIDLNSARIQHTRFVFFVPVRSRQEETALAKEIAKLDGEKSPHWIEAVVKAGMGDYYPRPAGGKLLRSINHFSSIVSTHPRLVETNTAVVAKLAEALQNSDPEAMDAHIRHLLECIPAPISATNGPVTQ